jgi:hypothetical protein
VLPSLLILAVDAVPAGPPTSDGSLLAVLSIVVASLAGIAAVITARATKGSSAVSGFQALNAAIVKERDAYRAASEEKDRAIAELRDRIGYLETRLWANHIDPDPDPSTAEEPTP